MKPASAHRKARTCSTLPLSPSSVTAIRLQRARQNAGRLAAGSGWPDIDLVFAGPEGAPVDGPAITKALQTTLERAGLPRQRFHDLRHACAPLMLSQGVPLAMVSRTLGHSTVTLTLDTYGHLSAEALLGTAEAMDAIFDTGSKVTDTSRRQPREDEAQTVLAHAGATVAATGPDTSSISATWSA